MPGPGLSRVGPEQGPTGRDKAQELGQVLGGPRATSPLSGGTTVSYPAGGGGVYHDLEGPAAWWCAPWGQLKLVTRGGRLRRRQGPRPACSGAVLGKLQLWSSKPRIWAWVAHRIWRGGGGGWGDLGQSSPHWISHRSVRIERQGPESGGDQGGGSTRELGEAAVRKAREAAVREPGEAAAGDPREAAARGLGRISMWGGMDSFIEAHLRFREVATLLKTAGDE